MKEQNFNDIIENFENFEKEIEQHKNTFPITHFFKNATLNIKKNLINYLLTGGVLMSLGILSFEIPILYHQNQEFYKNQQNLQNIRDDASYFLSSSPKNMEDFSNQINHDKIKNQNITVWSNHILEDLNKQKLSVIESPFEKGALMYYVTSDNIKKFPFIEKILENEHVNVQKKAFGNAFHSFSYNLKSIKDIGKFGIVVEDSKVGDFFNFTNNKKIKDTFILLHEMAHDHFIQLFYQNTFKNTTALSIADESHSDVSAFIMLQKTYNLNQKESLHYLENLIKFRNKNAKLQEDSSHYNIGALETLQYLYKNNFDFMESIPQEYIAFFASDLVLNSNMYTWERDQSVDYLETLSQINDEKTQNYIQDMTKLIKVNNFVNKDLSKKEQIESNHNIIKTFMRLNIWKNFEQSYNQNKTTTYNTVKNIKNKKTINQLTNTFTQNFKEQKQEIIKRIGSQKELESKRKHLITSLADKIKKIYILKHINQSNLNKYENKENITPEIENNEASKILEKQKTNTIKVASALISKYKP